MSIDIKAERIAFAIWESNQGEYPDHFDIWLAAKRHAAQVAEPVKCGCTTCLDASGETVELFGMQIPISDTMMVLCQTCGNKRCPHAKDHRNACTDSNEPGQAGSNYEGQAAPSGARVPMPVNADQAVGMLSLAHMWLVENAPDRLKPSGASVEGDEWDAAIAKYERSKAEFAEIVAKNERITAHYKSINDQLNLAVAAFCNSLSSPWRTFAAELAAMSPNKEGRHGK